MHEVTRNVKIREAARRPGWRVAGGSGAARRRASEEGASEEGASEGFV